MNSNNLNVSNIARFILFLKAKLRQRFNFHSKRSSEKIISQYLYAKNDAQSIKFFQHQKSFHAIVYQKNKNILVKFDEIFLIFHKFDEISS